MTHIEDMSTEEIEEYLHRQEQPIRHGFYTANRGGSWINSLPYESEKTVFENEAIKVTSDDTSTGVYFKKRENGLGELPIKPRKYD